MTRNELKQFITDFYQAWAEQDASKVEQFYDKEVKAYVDYSPVTLKDMLNRLTFSKEIFLKANYDFQDVVIDEEKGQIAVRINQHYVVKNTLEEISCKSMMLYTVVNNKLTEIWMSFFPNVNYLDNEKVSFVK